MANELSGEQRLIARYFRPLAKHPAALGLLDAAALDPLPAAIWCSRPMGSLAACISSTVIQRMRWPRRPCAPFSAISRTSRERRLIAAAPAHCS